MTIEQDIFAKLLKLIPDLETISEPRKLKAPGFMDLGIDVLGRHHMKLTLALSHYYKHPSGDMIPDPDMEVVVYFGTKTAEALAYQDCFGYRRAFREDMSVISPAIKKELNTFLTWWLDNLLAQGQK